MNFITGKKTYVMGIIMVLHGLFAIYLSYQNKTALDNANIMEIETGLGLIFLRQAVNK